MVVAALTGIFGGTVLTLGLLALALAVYDEWIR